MPENDGGLGFPSGADRPMGQPSEPITKPAPQNGELKAIPARPKVLRWDVNVWTHERSSAIVPI